MPVELWFVMLVCFDTGELLAEGEMTFGEADALIAAFYPGRNVQVLTHEDIYGPDYYNR